MLADDKSERRYLVTENNFATVENADYLIPRGSVGLYLEEL